MTPMPRRNNRPDSHRPLDLTPDEIPTVPTPVYDRNMRENQRRAAEYTARLEQERIQRQAIARVNNGIDWSVCIVPGCGESLVTWGRQITHKDPRRRDSRMELPICFDHAAVIWNQLIAFHRKDEKLGEAIADVNDMIAARKRAEEQEAKAEFLAREDGDIYFIRLGGMVKVGWTRDLWGRVKSYGASAELLVSYPATRSDETNLHRQLRPALAKGREWYEDGQIIASFIDEALAKYGEPPVFESMWTQPKRIVAGKRHR